MTAALAYPANSQIPIKTTRSASAAHDLAVVWAVTQLADSMPATIDDRVVLEAARAQLSTLADLLGTDEEGMRRVLEERYTSDSAPRRGHAAPP